MVQHALSLNWSLFRAINGRAGHHDLFDPAMIFAANALIFLLPLLLLVLWLGLARWSPLARRGSMRDSVRDSVRLAGHVDLLLAVFAAAVALGINLLVGHLLFEPRPFVANPAAVHKLIPYAADASFPSDHTAIAFAIVFVLIAAAIRLTRNRAAGLLAFVIAFLALLAAMVIAFARVYVGVHYPGDVLGGAVCGALGATIALALRPLLAPLLTPAVGALGRIGLA